jgi:hypothetical protein
MITGYGDPPHGCLRAFGKTGQEKLTGRRRVYATSTVYANAGYNPIIPCWLATSMAAVVVPGPVPMR